LQNAEIVVATVAKVSNRRDPDKSLKRKRKLPKEPNANPATEQGQMSKLIRAFGQKTDQLLQQVSEIASCWINSKLCGWNRVPYVHALCRAAHSVQSWGHAKSVE
jgi:hypothetical protein